jgi:hypothetical protein
LFDDLPAASTKYRSIRAVLKIQWGIKEDIAVAGYIEGAAQARRLLVIVVEDVDQEMLAACISKKFHGQLQVVTVKAPGFGNNHKLILGDLDWRHMVHRRIGYQA